MNDSLTSTQNTEEIDLIEIIINLWNEKWKIIVITIATFVLGLAYIFNTSDNYKVSLKISPVSPSQFSKYISINDILSKIPLPFSKITPNGDLVLDYYSITPDTVFKLFLSEFNKKEDVIRVLSSSEYRDQSNQDENIELSTISQSKEFEVIQQKNEGEYFLEFEWPKKNSIEKLGNDVIVQTLMTVKKITLDDLAFLRDYVYNKNQRLINNLTKEIEILIEEENQKIENRLFYLNEQYLIAEKLNPDPNLFDQTLLEVSPYLKGTSVIEQEIENLKARGKKEIVLMSEDITSKKNQIKNLKSDTSSEYIESAIEIVLNEDPSDWIDYNLKFAIIENSKKTKQILILSLMMGLFLGSLYVLVFSSIRRRFSSK